MSVMSDSTIELTTCQLETAPSVPKLDPDSQTSAELDQASPIGNTSRAQIASIGGLSKPRRCPGCHHVRMPSTVTGNAGRRYSVNFILYISLPKRTVGSRVYRESVKRHIVYSSGYIRGSGGELYLYDI